MAFRCIRVPIARACRIGIPRAQPEVCGECFLGPRNQQGEDLIQIQLVNLVTSLRVVTLRNAETLIRVPWLCQAA